MTVIRPNAIAGINSITIASGAALAVHKADGTLIQTLSGAAGVSTFTSISVGSATTSNSAAKSINIGLGASISQHTDNSLSFGTNGDERLKITSTGLVGIATNNPQKTLNVFAGVGTTELIRLSQPVDSSVQQEFGIGWCSNNNHTHPGAQITSLEYDVSDPRRDLLFYTRGVNSDSAPTERLRIDSSGRVNAVGIVSATGGLQVGAAATIKSDGNATFAGIVTATAFKGDGSGLSGVTATTINNNADNRLITGSDTANTLNGEANLTLGNNLQFTTTANGHSVILKSTGAYYNKLSLDSAVTSADAFLNIIDFSWDGDKVADIVAISGSDTTNKDDGHLVFRTSASQGSITERLRITKNGYIGINTATPGRMLHIVGEDGPTQATVGNSDTQLVLDNKGTNGAIIEFLAETGGAGRIMFTDTDASNQGQIEYTHSDDMMDIQSAGGFAVHVAGSEDAINASANGAVRLYYNNALKIETGSSHVWFYSDPLAANTSFNLGNSSSGRWGTMFSTATNVSSDISLKNSIATSDLGLDFINNLLPKSYKWNDTNLTQNPTYGLIAQDVQEALTKAGKTSDDFAGLDIPENGDPCGLDYLQFIAPLVKAVQELSAKVTALEGG